MSKREPTDPTILPDRYVRIRRPEEGRYKNSGWASALLIVTVAIGWAFPWHEDPPVTRDCDPVTSTEYPAARDVLISQGYHADATGHLIPPGCSR